MNKKKIEINELFPSFTADQLDEAADALHSYIEITRRIYERKHGLTGFDRPGTI
jgi:hypothetical protein